MVVLSDEDMKTLPSRSSKEISIEKFVPADQIDPLFDRSSPRAGQDRPPCRVLLATRSKADRMAVVTVSIRTRMTLAVLRVREGVIVLQTLLWGDEVRQPEFEFLSENTQATDKELAMAASLVDSLAGDYEPDEFEDDYSEAVEALVASKIEGGEMKEAPAPAAEETEVVDLLAALQRSATGQGGQVRRHVDERDPRGSHGKPADTAKKAPTKKAAAKRAPAEDGRKKTTTKKAASKRKAS